MTTEKVRHALHRAVTEGGVPGILAEARQGDSRWFGADGTADRETGRERRQEDRFRIGSITKTFVATVALRLTAEGTLNLNDTVEKWLPGLLHGNGHDGSSVTLAQLLNNTSGTVNYTDDTETLQQTGSCTPEELVRMALAHPAPFAPGTDWAYSNTNYILAGLIIERATGRPLVEGIVRHITGPLGLSGTYLPRGDDSSIAGPHSRHYTKLHSPDPDAEIYDATELDPTPYWAAGAMISTAGDLNRFFRALLGGRLLPAPQQAEMFTMVPTKDWLPGTTYGFGISSLTLTEGRTLWGMAGALFGSWTCAYGTRDGRHVLTVNLNADWANAPWDDPLALLTEVLAAQFQPDEAADRTASGAAAGTAHR
ncbi:serine hydrolase domain-containing protein [Streptomyces sp. 3N207]|uniref:serine hydrolase domain-containing protein n=1 Tax=Streptomyces sp. 3N207 TaxID=3457417 RepID=UPI003FD334B4